VRLVWDEEDRWVDPSVAERLQREIPGSTLDLVAGAGHFVMEDAPQEVATILLDFFSRDTPPSGRWERPFRPEP
jgi:pimeloyl-ACP methyl ester carboxylesterase